MSEAPAIEVTKLHKVYRDGIIFRRPFAALKGISLIVKREEIFGLLGPNGAGKTTLVKLLLGIVRKTQGEARLLGRPAGDRHSRKEVGYLPENLRIARHHTARSALNMYGQMSGLTRAEIRERGTKLLDMVDLTDRAKDPIKKYSKGMLQRLGLSIALLHDPQLIFMDEPTDGLDPAARAKVRQVLQRLKDEGKTIFLNSHLLQEVEMVCDRVAILDRGVLRGVGTAAQLAAQHNDGLKIELEVAGREEAIHAVLANTCQYELTPTATETYKTTLQLTEQSQVDRCVDALRSQGVSIISLVHHRVTLEETFLDLLGIEAELI